MGWKAALLGAGLATLGAGCAPPSTADLAAQDRSDQTIDPDSSVPDVIEPDRVSEENRDTAPAADPGPDDDQSAVIALEAPSEPELRRFTIAASGDLLIHGGVRRQAAEYGQSSEGGFDFRPMFEHVKPIFADADLSICHLEVPLSADNTGLSGYPLFLAPRELADAIRYAEFDGCSTASNHSMDQGGTGAAQTLDVLDGAGVGHAGMARTEEEAKTPSTYTVAEVEVAHLSYTYGLNGMPTPRGKPWMVDLIDEEQILADAAASRAAGAEFVIASMHWGTQYQQDPTREQRDLAEAMLEDGAVDLILGHHAHVVQPIAQVDERYAVYGLGNFLSNQADYCCLPETQDGVIVLIDIEETDTAEFRTANVSYVPTWVDRDDFTIYDVGTALEDPDLDEDRRAVLQTSFDRTVSAITADGADDLGVAPVTSGRLPAQAPPLDAGSLTAK